MRTRVATLLALTAVAPCGARRVQKAFQENELAADKPDADQIKDDGVEFEAALEKRWITYLEKTAEAINDKNGIIPHTDPRYAEAEAKETDSLAETASGTAVKPSACLSSHREVCHKGSRGGRYWGKSCAENLYGNPPEPWEPVLHQLNCYVVAMEAGTPKGPAFRMENGGRNFDEAFPTYSGGKRPGAVAAARMVDAGKLTFDTKANEVFDWWSKDEADTKSQVTFGQLLAMSSGFIVEARIYDFDHASAQNCLDKGTKYTDLESCAKQIYYNTKHVTVDTQFQYNSLHIQLAVAMAVKVSGLDTLTYLKTHLYDPANMTNSQYMGGSNPFIAGGMITTGNDYANFLRAYLGYEMVKKETADVMEREYMAAHGLRDVGKFVRYTNFAMSQYNLTGEAWPECLTMGGSQVNCIDRLTNTYWIIMPKVREYTGRALGGGAIISAEVLMWSSFWMRGPLHDALGAVNAAQNPPAPSLPAGASALEASAKEEVLHCDGFCVECNEGNRGVYVARSQTVLQKIAKVAYLDPTLGALKLGYHISRHALGDVIGLPNECPNAEIFFAEEGAPKGSDITMMPITDDVNNMGALPLFKKSMNSLYSHEMDCIACQLPDQTLPPSLTKMMDESPVFCKDFGGMKRVETWDAWDTLGSNKWDRIGSCLWN